MNVSVFEKTRSAGRSILKLSDAIRSELLFALADQILADESEILNANSEDLSRMDPANPLYDRLLLNHDRLVSIASDMRNVAALECPLGRIIHETVRPNGMRLKKVRVPYGVIGVIYEARPNVTFDVFSLCFKTGNACILKGGKDADSSNTAAVRIIKRVLSAKGLDENAVNLLPATHEGAASLLNAVGYVDLVIPRGGRRLIDFVRQNAKVPCIETGAGVVDAYFDAEGDLEMGKAIVLNAKTRRVSVCNALDCLLVHRSRLSDLPELVAPLSEKNVILYADKSGFDALKYRYPYLEMADETSYGTEYMDYKMAVKTVDNLDEALEHISMYGSGHSEAIITSDAEAARRFQIEVDAACVYVNVPTSFTDGAQFGLGAEIGISTQKLGARGPMGLEEITTYKWLVEGEGQIRG